MSTNILIRLIVGMKARFDFLMMSEWRKVKGADGGS